jgi:20S proteasome alpha/beta subunit
MLLLSILSLISLVIDSALANQNYNAYNYDMTTPQFTPDGRLLQVEYASRAATHSSPCVLWKCDTHETLVMTRKSSRKLQNRLIQLSDTTAVCLSGVVSDSLALLAKVYELQDNNRRLYGSKTLTEHQIASAIATACQRHSFGGGLRPYGSTIVVISPRTMLQTDPSGAVVTLDGKLNVVASSNAELRRKLENENSPTTLAEAMLTVAKHLVPDKDDKDAWLEVLVLSKEKGVHKLSDDQVERLLLKLKEQ